MKRHKRLSRTPGYRMPRSPMKRGQRIARVNRKRKASEFARCYHSRERVRFVKGLGCLICVAVGAEAYVASVGRCDNAHTETDGMGRKAGYDTIVPLCREHHRRYDEHRHPCDKPEVRQYLKTMAPKIEAAWQSHTQRGKAAA